MTKQERDELDAKVLAAIRKGRCRLTTIAIACGVQGLAALSAGSPETRAVDRALQRLRKSGKVSYGAAHGWRVV